MGEEDPVAFAGVVQALLAARRPDDPVLRAFPVAGAEVHALPAVAGERIAFGCPNLRCFSELTSSTSGILMMFPSRWSGSTKRSPLCSRATPRPQVGLKMQTVPADPLIKDLGQEPPPLCWPDRSVTVFPSWNPVSFFRSTIGMKFSRSIAAWTPVGLVIGAGIFAAGCLQVQDADTPGTPIRAPAIARPPSLSVNATLIQPSYLPGEEVEVQIAFMNGGPDQLTICSFPPTVSLTNPTWGVVRTFSHGNDTILLEPGESVNHTLK